MKYFASENAITEQDMAGQLGWIEIDASQHEDALDALLSGRELTVINDAMVIREKRPSEHHEWQDGEWVFMPPESEPEPELHFAPLTARQLRLGLVAASILPAHVDAAIAVIPDATDRAVAEIEWEYASQFERDHPLIEQVGAALGLSPEQIDAMWQAAAGL